MSETMMFQCKEFFHPIDLSSRYWIGWIAAVLAMLCNSAAVVNGRSINRSGDFFPLTVTLFTMGIGGTLLLLSGLLFQGLPEISLTGLVIILWLAMVNTAIAFSFWNVILRVLPAAESSVMINSMMIQIHVSAVIFSGETPSPNLIFGLTAAIAGILVVQLHS